jgi:glycosyltransferase involved in cell wall biosynthesis
VLDEITPVIIARDEEANIGRTLSCLTWAREVVLVDSGSTDRTLEIARSFGNVRVVERPLDDLASQWSFAARQATTEWLLTLDADYLVPADAVDELRKMTPPANVSAYEARFLYAVRGRPLRTSLYPPRLVLLRNGASAFFMDGHTQRVRLVRGSSGSLSSPLIHDDRKPFRRWFNSQSRYTELEAQKLRATDPHELEFADRLRRWRFIVPPAMLVYCLVVRGGILDGWAGFYYAFQRAMAELMLGHRLSGSKPRI